MESNMSITNVRTVQRVEVYPPADADGTGNDAEPTVMVVYEHTFDDTTDAELPVTTTKVKHISRYQEDGTTATDVSGDDQLVQDICGGIWS